MVTFPVDYWAPALDVNVRRRGTSDSMSQRRNTQGKHPKPLTLFTDPKQDLVIPYVSSPVKDINPFDGLLSRNSPPSASSSVSTNSTIPPSTPTESKKMKFVQRIFSHESKSPNISPTNSPQEDKDEYFSTTPAKLRDILTPRLLDNMNVTKGDSGSENGKIVDPECQLNKKYGICEKGCIGKGATAVVRLAHKLDQSDNKSEKTYAVKEFRKKRKNETEKDYVKKLTSEFCISSTLQHVNIVKTVDLVQDENHNWCEVMEYCPGGDLFTAIKAGHMTSVEINCCFKQLIQGVGYLHANGVAHRDIKPENLLLDSKGYLKITDFGVSDVFRTCWEETAHKSKGLCGSEPYIAPEQFESKEYDARLVDVWACGIVYYCMIYKGIPFRMATPTDPNYANYLETRNIGQYEPIEKLPRGSRDLMYRILEPDPAKRITISEIEKNAWFQTITVCTDTKQILFQEHHHIPPDCLKETQPNAAKK